MKAQDCRAGGQHVARERGAYLDEPKQPPKRRAERPEKPREPATFRPFLQFFTAQSAT